MAKSKEKKNIKKMSKTKKKPKKQNDIKIDSINDIYLTANKNPSINIKNIDDEFLVQWGLNLIKNNRFEHAIKIFNYALNINPYNSDAYYHKGKCLIHLADRENGLKCFDIAMSIKNTELEIQKNSINLIDFDDINEKLNNLLEDNTDIVFSKNLFYEDENTFDRTIDNFNIVEYPNIKKRKEIIENDYINNSNSKIVKDMKKNPNPIMNSVDKKSNSRTDHSKNEYRLNLQEDYLFKNNIYDGFSSKIDQLLKPKSKLKEPDFLINCDYNKDINDYDELGDTIFPDDGGLIQDNRSFFNEFIEYQKDRIDKVIEYLINHHGGCFYYSVEPQYMFKVSLILLQKVLDEYHMDGIIISVEKPAKYIQRILNKNIRSKYPPFYIDCNIGLNNVSNNVDINASLNTKTNETNVGVEKQIQYIEYLKDNFNFQHLHDAVEVNIQKIAELYEGEHHFIFIDNISMFKNYTSEREVKKYISQFARELKKLNMYGFFMIPKGSIKRTVIDIIKDMF
jgi:tetratricopeptide (TPR) repeat protein